jgi:hypothetical protein
MVLPLSEFLLASFAAIFAALTETGEPAYRRHTAMKSVAVAAGLLLIVREPAVAGFGVPCLVGIEPTR